MIGFLQLWGLLGSCVLIFELVALHRRGGTLARICDGIRAQVASGEAPGFIGVLGRRWVVALIVIGLWPVPIALRIMGQRG